MGVELTFMTIFMILFFSYFHDTLYNFLIIKKKLHMIQIHI